MPRKHYLLLSAPRLTLRTHPKHLPSSFLTPAPPALFSAYLGESISESTRRLDDTVNPADCKQVRQKELLEKRHKNTPAKPDAAANNLVLLPSLAASIFHLASCYAPPRYF